MSTNKKILLVDDTPDILEALELVLSMEGYTTERAVNQDQVNAVFKNTSQVPDLILLDVLLSGQDGRIIAQQLKSLEVSKHIPIIMMSAHPNVEKTIKESGADDFIPKPFEIDVLMTTIKKYLGKK